MMNECGKRPIGCPRQAMMVNTSSGFDTLEEEETVFTRGGQQSEVEREPSRSRSTRLPSPFLPLLPCTPSSSKKMFVLHLPLHFTMANSQEKPKGFPYSLKDPSRTLDEVENLRGAFEKMMGGGATLSLWYKVIFFLFF